MGHTVDSPEFRRGDLELKGGRASWNEVLRMLDGLLGA